MTDTAIFMDGIQHVGTLCCRRDDEVATWLKKRRDEYDLKELSGYDRYHAIDLLLDEYRLCADVGWTLPSDPDEEVEEWPADG